MDRELNSIEKEFQRYLDDDSNRLWQLFKSSCRPTHPFFKFDVGNLDSLKFEPEKRGVNVRDELIKFYNKHYSANLMTLCLLGNESLDQLEQYAIDMFSAVPNKNLDVSVFDPDLFDSDADIFYVVPVQNLKEMSVSWIVPYLDHKYDTHSYNYLGHLICHKADGSLLAELKRRRWAVSLNQDVSPDSSMKGFDAFRICMKLTEQGSQKVDEILTLLYQYINMLKRHGPQEWIVNEMIELGKQEFEYQENCDPFDYVQNMSNNLALYAPSDVLCADYYSLKYDPDLIESLFAYLVPDKMRVMVISREYEIKANQAEKWYGTRFGREKIAPELLERLESCGYNDEAFRLPSKNEFIARDLDFIEHAENGDGDEPRIVRDSSLSRVWFKEDTKFGMPKLFMTIIIVNKMGRESAKNIEILNLFQSMLKDKLDELLYYARLADFGFSMETSVEGVRLDFSGFNDKFILFLNKVIQFLLSHQFDRKDFEQQKEKRQRELSDFETLEASDHANFYLDLAIANQIWSQQDRRFALDQLDFEEFEKIYIDFLTNQIFLESIVYGNLTEKVKKIYHKDSI